MALLILVVPAVAVWLLVVVAVASVCTATGALRVRSIDRTTAQPAAGEDDESATWVRFGANLIAARNSCLISRKENGAQRLLRARIGLSVGEIGECRDLRASPSAAIADRSEAPSVDIPSKGNTSSLSMISNELSSVGEGEAGLTSNPILTFVGFGFTTTLHSSTLVLVPEIAVTAPTEHPTSAPPAPVSSTSSMVDGLRPISRPP
uniref:Putative secreted peptide n=1 Tax=Anopheles braziliensis TaxID=58242 RepID=A0A2M3ZRE5_9DIPT